MRVLHIRRRIGKMKTSLRHLTLAPGIILYH